MDKKLHREMYVHTIKARNEIENLVKLLEGSLGYTEHIEPIIRDMHASLDKIQGYLNNTKIEGDRSEEEPNTGIVFYKSENVKDMLGDSAFATPILDKENKEE